ncbi:EAL domain-containing protein [Thiomonas sp.]|jgi:EAL domain-containing protein (putative c-di-GMP-specific phosphodiesterase class I)|uniref:EAL domain-containing protein n=1 Tax=Thiomonas sp. TaxID=2047785 RepID=UPI0026354CF8|nr:EAL domain-containing protein [Thiomonas sp.]
MSHSTALPAEPRRRALRPARGAQPDLMDELRLALRRGQLRLAYQPIHRMRGADPSSFEALLRWRHPVLGDVAPEHFIDLAERSGLILEIGDWAFRAAAAECRRLRATSGRAVHVAINVSPLQLSSRTTVQLWLRHLQDIDLPPDAISVEITERVMVRHPEAAAGQLRLLADAGVRIALDDFGVGYSNLAMLGQLPVHALKFDRSLTQALVDSERHRTIACSVVDMAHRLRMQVVAEGIERTAQAALTHEMGFDFGQGYWYGRPLSAAQAEQWLRAA